MPPIIFFDEKLVAGPNGPKEKIFERADAHKKINMPASPTLKQKKTAVTLSPAATLQMARCPNRKKFTAQVHIAIFVKNTFHFAVRVWAGGRSKKRGNCTSRGLRMCNCVFPSVWDELRYELACPQAGILANDKCFDSALAELGAIGPNYGDSKPFSVRRSGFQAGGLKMVSSR